MENSNMELPHLPRSRYRLRSQFGDVQVQDEAQSQCIKQSTGTASHERTARPRYKEGFSSFLGCNPWIKSTCGGWHRGSCQAGPDLDLWGPLGRLSCGGPNIMIFMEAIKLSSEASEPLAMRGTEKRPLKLQRFLFFHFWSAYLNNFITICWCVRKQKIVLNFVVENNNWRLYAL